MACPRCGCDTDAYQKRQKELNDFEAQFGDKLAKLRKDYRTRMNFIVLPLVCLFIFCLMLVADFLVVMDIAKEGTISLSDFPNCYPFAGIGGLYVSLGLPAFYSLIIYLGCVKKWSGTRSKEEKKLWKEFQEKYNQKTM